MKKISAIVLVIFIAASSSGLAQTLSGSLDVGGRKLELIFLLTPEGGTIDVPAQLSYGMKLTSSVFERDSLFITLDALKVTFTGRVFGSIDSVNGIYTQSGRSVPLTLFPKPDYQTVKRTQNIEPPFPYYSVDTVFNNTSAGVTLAGTVTAPDDKGKYPAVILVTGSGPQNRDEELAGHKPFLVIADWLARNGVVTLRYDDRGFAKSTGNFRAATTLDFAGDASAAIDFLRTLPFVDTAKVGLIGHSEGGLIAPIVADMNKGTRFIIPLAGPGVNGKEIILRQSYLLAEAEGGDTTDLALSIELTKTCIDAVLANPAMAAKQIDSAYKAFFTRFTPEEKDSLMKKEQFDKRGLFSFTTPWFIQFLTLEPVPYYEKITVPVLGLWGSKDLQVPPTQSIPPVKAALEKAGVRHELEVLDSMNHLFQRVKTGAISEYGTTETTIEREVLERIVKFIKSL